MKLTCFIKETVFDAARILTTKEGIKSLYGVSLYRNAIYLMLDSAITAIAGLFFWVAAARLYATESIGLASAAISAITLLGTISSLGLGFALIRFLPGSGERSCEMINSCFTTGGILSLALALVFLAGLPFWSPVLLPIRNHPVFFITFVAFVLAYTLFSFARVTFMAQRRAGFVLFQGIIANLLRFIPLVLLSAVFTTFGVFASWGIAILIGGAAAILLFLPLAQTGYRPLPTVRRKIINDMLHFSLTNYLVSLLALASSSVLPLMVVNVLGAEQNAYFYIAWMIGIIIATIPTAITTSLFAEGSYDERMLGNQVRRSLKFIFLLLFPVIVLTLLLGAKLLFLFGSAYSQNATTLLWLVTITALPLSINSLYYTVKRVQKKMKSVVILNGFIAAVTLGLSYFLLSQMGVLATGIAWLSANGIVALLIAAGWLKKQTLLT